MSLELTTPVGTAGIRRSNCNRNQATGMIWTDVEDIAIQLQEKNPELDPLTLRFTALRDLVTALPGFEGEADKVSEKILEAIQMAWHEEYQDA